jgi:hypothetical protein
MENDKNPFQCIVPVMRLTFINLRVFPSTFQFQHLNQLLVQFGNRCLQKAISASFFLTNEAKSFFLWAPHNDGASSQCFSWYQHCNYFIMWVNVFQSQNQFFHLLPVTNNTAFAEKRLLARSEHKTASIKLGLQIQRHKTQNLKAV